MIRVLVVLMLTLAGPAAAADTPAMTRQERAAAIRNLHWFQVGTFKLPLSASTLVLPADHSVLIGAEARRFMTLIGNPGDAALEAVAVDRSLRDQVDFRSYSEGYVSLDDWKDTDAAAMLTAIRDNTEKRNEERRRQGIDELHVTRWLQEPTLDRATNTAYWAIAADTPHGPIVNAIALRLSRNGYEKLTWVTNQADYVQSGGELDRMLAAHSFDPGFRYSDHVAGDKLAAYGIAGLVAAVAGAKALKLAGAGALLLLLKKFGVIILGALAGLLYRLKKMFGRSGN